MLRIPLPSAAHSGAYIPEDDGFALAMHVGCFAREPCVKGQRVKFEVSFLSVPSASRERDCAAVSF